jgi:hypothetical protein
MRFNSRRWLWLTCCLLAGAGIALAADRGDAQRFEYIITFDKVIVEGIDGVTETPAMAHIDLPTAIPREQPGAAPRDPMSVEKTSPWADRKADQAKGTERFVQTSTPPGHGFANPSFVQEGFLVEAFWAGKVGTGEGFFKRAHFHPPDLSTGFEAQHLGNPNELHGIFIRSVDGKRFGLKSLRYRVTRNRQIPSKPVSIEGFSNFNVTVLVARSFDPRTPIRTQFVSFPAGLPVGNDTSLPWWPLRIFGFELVSQLYIASSASVDFDDIVLTRSEPPPVPSDQHEKDE